MLVLKTAKRVYAGVYAASAPTSSVHKEGLDAIKIMVASIECRHPVCIGRDPLIVVGQPTPKVGESFCFAHCESTVKSSNCVSAVPHYHCQCSSH